LSLAALSPGCSRFTQAPPPSRNPPAVIEPLSKRDLPFCDPAKSLPAWAQNRRRRSYKGTARAFYADVDIGALAGRARCARSEQKDAAGGIGHMPPDHRSGKFGGVHWVPDRLHAVISLPARAEQGDRRRVRNPRARRRDGLPHEECADQTPRPRHPPPGRSRRRGTARTPLHKLERRNETPLALIEMFDALFFLDPVVIARDPRTTASRSRPFPPLPMPHSRLTWRS
jgi:hypothetical protein